MIKPSDRRYPVNIVKGLNFKPSIQVDKCIWKENAGDYITGCDVSIHGSYDVIIQGETKYCPCCGKEVEYE